MSDDQEKASLATQVGRWIQSILLLVVTFWLGLWLGGIVAGYTDRVAFLREGVPALGIGVLLAMVQELSSVMFKLVEYARSGQRWKLRNPVVTVLVGGLTIALSLHFVEITVGESSEAATGTIVVWDGYRPSVQTADPESGPYAVFSVFFREASGYDPTTRTFASGTSLVTSESRTIGRLAASLAACSGSGEGAVRLSVRGFASSSGYRGYTDEEAAEINVLVANSRARAVAQAIQAGLAGDAGVTLEVTEWGSSEELEAAQAFKDNAAEEYRPEHGFLTRRAEIVLEDPGSCRVE